MPGAPNDLSSMLATPPVLPLVGDKGLVDVEVPEVLDAPDR